MIELWKPIEGFEGRYEISNKGRVKSLIRPRIMKPSHQKSGYYQISLSLNKKAYYRWVHRLVAKAFLPSSEKYYVNHIDGNKSNNIYTNLEFCTIAENNKHAGDLNLKPIGSNHTNSKLTHEQLKEVRYLLSTNNYTHKEIAKKFNVHRATISRIFRNQSYKKETI